MTRNAKKEILKALYAPVRSLRAKLRAQIRKDAEQIMALAQRQERELPRSCVGVRQPA